MSKLKIYTGNYDGRRGIVVATTSKSKASELLGVSLHTMKNFFRETDHPFFTLCLSTPGTVYEYDLSDYSGSRKLIPILKSKLNG